MVKQVIKFSATWCAPCKAFAPTFNKVKAMDEFKNIEFKELDIEEDEEGIDLVEKFQIRSVPTTVLVDDNGEVLVKVSGAIPLGDFANIIREKSKPSENNTEQHDAA